MKYIWKCTNKGKKNSDNIGFEIGKEYESQNIDSNMINDNGLFLFMPISDMKEVEFELVRTEFEKSDLLPNMVIKTRGGELCIISECELGKCATSSLGYYLIINEFTNDLKDRELELCDIVEVYSLSKSYKRAMEISTIDRELLWKRNDVTEMTIEEIEKELGKKIKRL